MEWLRRLLGLSSPQAPPEGAPTPVQVSASPSEIQALKLDLQEKEEQLKRTQQELERQRSHQEELVEGKVRTALSQVIEEAATPVSQLLTQIHLMDAEEKPVQARDIMTVAKRMVKVLQAHGMHLIGSVGDQVTFDPNRHMPLSNQTSLEPGQSARVRFVGIAYQDQVIRKAGVEPEGD